VGSISDYFENILDEMSGRLCVHYRFHTGKKKRVVKQDRAASGFEADDRCILT
jgi:hypothetical protein